MSLFKCYVCREVMNKVPYCWHCDIALPNSCIVPFDDPNYKKLAHLFGISPNPGKTEKKKNRKIANQNKNKGKNFDKLEYEILYGGRIRENDEDFDLKSDFDNLKAAAILKIIHSGIKKKKSYYTGDARLRLQKVYQRRAT